MNQRVERKNVIVIGAGIGGITTAANLASKGFKVRIFEKNPYPGGRCGRIVKEGHRFDMGATFLMMPGIYEEAFFSLRQEPVRGTEHAPGRSRL